MPAPDHLAELARQVRGDTLRLLAATPDDWLTYAPAGTSNHILWHAGHAVWLQDVLFIEPATGRCELPAGWEETFGMDCRPLNETSVRKLWPSRREVERLLTAQLPRVLELLADLPAANLAAAAPPLPGYGSRNLQSCCIHAWHDEARHQGEMYLLTKLRRAAKA
jgi:hypothetical protein